MSILTTAANGRATGGALGVAGDHHIREAREGINDGYIGVNILKMCVLCYSLLHILDDSGHNPR